MDRMPSLWYDGINSKNEGDPGWRDGQAERIRELTLMLISLTSWENLVEERLIYDNRRALGPFTPPRVRLRCESCWSNMVFDGRRA